MFRLKNIREYRKLKNMTQEDLAFELEVTQTVIYKIENNLYNSSIKLKTILQIADELDVELMDILELK